MDPYAALRPALAKLNNELRECRECFLTKPITEFYATSVTKKDGGRYHARVCKACCRTRTQIRRHNGGSIV